jgi:hypothetical protein
MKAIPERSPNNMESNSSKKSLVLMVWVIGLLALLVLVGASGMLAPVLLRK